MIEKNIKLIDDFINLYNDFNMKDYISNKLELNKNTNCIFFLVIDDNKYGNFYIKIYQEFIAKQNHEKKSLIKIKIIQEYSILIVKIK